MAALALDELRPMLALQRSVPAFSHPDWVFEVKYDGFRCLAEFDKGGARLLSREGTDMSAWFPELVASLAGISKRRCVVDGEIAVLDAQGIAGDAEFQRLVRRAARRGRRWVDEPVVFCIFDTLVLSDKSLMEQPLVERKRHLQRLFAEVPRTLVIQHIAEHGEALYREAVRLRLEGLVAKRAMSTYQPGARSADWRKIKRPGAVPAERFRSRGKNSLSVDKNVDRAVDLL